MPRLAIAANGGMVAAWRSDAPPAARIEAATAPPYRHVFRAPRPLAAPGPVGAALHLAVGPRAQAAVGWGGTGGGWPLPAHAPPAVQATRPVGGAFAPGIALVSGRWSLAPVMAFDGTGALTTATVANDGRVRRLEVHRSAGSVPPASEARAPADVHLLWFSAAVAAAGPYTVVAWGGAASRIHVLTHVVDPDARR
jgi:hypothetical protein